MNVFLETNPLLDKVVVYKTQDEEYNYEYCEKWESARLRVKEGETLTVKDLLYASLVGSANNSIETLVRISGVERKEFIARMNNKVVEWGAKATHFIEPTGLSPENVSSAEDYAIITREVFINPLVEKISSANSYKFSTINTKQAHTLKNTSQLVSVGSSNFNIVGSKTGYLDEAGYCLMTRVKDHQGGYLIAITLGAKNKAQSIKDSSELLKYGLIQIKKEII
jgi:D-alanyl-D-alanine carboxypeptidase